MREVKHYICEVCGTEYAEKSKAGACEKNHKRPMEFVLCRYLPITNDGSGYPQTITVMMSDSQKVIYKR